MDDPIRAGLLALKRGHGIHLSDQELLETQELLLQELIRRKVGGQNTLKSTRSTGTVVMAKYMHATRGGSSVGGKPFTKGDLVIRVESTRQTGEVFNFLPSEVVGLLSSPPL